MARMRGTLLAGAIGAAVAYFLDPDRGRSRRAKTADQLGAVFRRGADKAGTQARYTAGVMEGARARASGAGQLSPEDDRDIVQGVKQRFSASGVDVSDVTVDCVDGVVALRGQVRTPDEQKKVEVEASQVPGVREVKSWLHLPGTTAPNVAASIEASATGTARPTG